MEKELRQSARRVQEFLQEHNLAIEVVEFKELTRTSVEAASVIGCEVGQIVKTLIFKGKKTGEPICVIASGTNRVDEKKIAALIGQEIEKPDADFVVLHTHFAIGGIPPIGFTFKQAALIDEDLLNYTEVWAAAGTPYAVFKIEPKDLLEITKGRVVNLRK
ncbi:MAG: YbaK/EbsC family protein [Verrucomicrobia bacterium]|nr:YbaK/EbsC family protein [Verrucomicrobiota bacterium]